MLIDGEGNDVKIKGDEGDDIVFLGPGADKVFTEQGNDTIYVLPDGQQDKIHCDDPTQGDSGNADRVIFVGWRDPADVIDYRGSCEIIEVTAELPAGWPYGLVPSQRSVMRRTAGTDLPR